MMKPALPHFRGAEHTARTLVLEVLLACGHGHAFIQEVLDQHLQRARLNPADQRLATQLAYGVLRRRASLDGLLRPLLRRRPHQVESWLWEALRLGALQLALLSHMPAHAAIHETVELAVAYGNPQARGFL